MVDRYKGGFGWVDKGFDRMVKRVCKLMKIYVVCWVFEGEYVVINNIWYNVRINGEFKMGLVLYVLSVIGVCNSICIKGIYILNCCEIVFIFYCSSLELMDFEWGYWWLKGWIEVIWCWLYFVI